MLSTVNLSYEQPGGLALQGVAVEVPRGQVVTVIGPNGAGKSTLVKLMAGVLAAADGAIEIDGIPVQGKDLPRHVAYLPQKLEVHWPLAVGQVVALGRQATGLKWYQRVLNPALNVDTRVSETLQQLDIAHLADRRVDRLSGGELTRVLLARALAMDASYLLVDEPVNNLDPAHQFSIMQVLRDEAQAGRGVLAVLHDLSLVKRFCDRVIVVNNGVVEDRGHPETALNAALLTQVFGIEPADLDFWLHKIG